jgi:hypothetical protein
MELITDPQAIRKEIGLGLEKWNNGRLEERKNGMLGGQEDGMIEGWMIGLKSRVFCFCPLFHHSHIPVFQFSGVPLFQDSGEDSRG